MISGWILLGLGLAVALAAAGLLIRNRGWFWPWLRGMLGLTVIAAGGLVALTGWALLTWQPLSANEPLYRLTMSQGADDASWRITQQYGQADERTHQVKGDYLELGGRLLVVDLSVAGLGSSMFYRAEALRGHPESAEAPVRFRSRTGERNLQGWLDPWHWDRSLPLPLIRAESAFPLLLPMADGAVFDIILQGHQLEAMPLNGVAEQVLEDRG